MINLIWVVMIGLGVGVAAATGRMDAMTPAIMESTREATKMAIALAGPLALWSGLMKIAEESGATDYVARVLRPVVRRLFPEIPEGHPAASSIIMSMSANLLGLGNAATPLGLRAMKHMQELNDDPETATDSMCTFLAITTSSITLVPTTIIALRASLGAENPADIMAPTLIATTCSTTAAIVFDRIARAAAGRPRGPKPPMAPAGRRKRGRAEAGRTTVRQAKGGRHG